MVFWLPDMCFGRLIVFVVGFKLKITETERDGKEKTENEMHFIKSIETETIELWHMRFFIVYCLLSLYILERRVFRRILDDKLGSVVRT